MKCPKCGEEMREYKAFGNTLPKRVIWHKVECLCCGFKLT